MVATVTIAELEQAQERAARLVITDRVYAPILLRLTRDLEQMRSIGGDARELARRILQGDTA